MPQSQLTWSVPYTLLDDSISLMRPHGACGNEGLALWFGSVEGNKATVTRIIAASGPGFVTSPDYLSLSSAAMCTLTDLAEQIDAVLVGQIHSHPGRFVDLSALDKEHGIRADGYLSVVCPFYAQRYVGLDECGVHVFDNFAYRRMSAREVSARIIPCDAELSIIRCEVPA